MDGCLPCFGGHVMILMFFVMFWWCISKLSKMYYGNIEYKY